MITFLAVIHIIACLGLVGLVLIQDSKGGGVFTSQSSSNSVLGATGANSLASTMTKLMAVLFAATSITLSVMSARSEKSVVDSMPAGAAIPTATATAPIDSAAPTSPGTPAGDTSKGTAPAQAAPTTPATNETK